MNRRDFLRRSAVWGGCRLPVASWLSLNALAQQAAQASAPASGYRALVCVMLAGGNDSFNMLVPRRSGQHAAGNWTGPVEAEWQKYLAIRGSVSLPNIFQSALPLYQANGQSLQSQALHGSMPRLQAIFNNRTSAAAPGVLPSGRHAAFVSNVGTLVEPITAAEARQRSKLLPLYLQSHVDQFDQWQTCFPQGHGTTGWAGRMMDQLHASPGSGSEYALVSMDGYNLALVGKNVAPFVEGAANRRLHSMVGGGFSARRDRLMSILNDDVNDPSINILDRAYSKMVRDGLQLQRDYADIVSPGVPAPADILGASNGHQWVEKMRNLAKVINACRAASASAGKEKMRRQVFFLTLGGWDHHDDLKSSHSGMLSLLDGALAEFYMQMKAIGALNDVTLFTASDFGRALKPNGGGDRAGTDHAWGGNQIVLGGAVNGGTIYGSYPSLKLMSEGINDPTNLDIQGNGVFLPTTSVDQYIQRLGSWLLHGTSGAIDWPGILPNWPQWSGSQYQSGTPLAGMMSA
ncbi:DUF1501 domain-containing protein [Phragmitibacter flavus]|uniref:DUF1501 domain-containing protein n=1 Tax=Phragmitibacter flavus TaxID=2576071 RepID=A0A5R8KFG0_9BACT|nr:DUF1501 domain-containing protein [Phragmitibacter flavus]TLD71034.1 DUF1501 domain-containing protein [Phragmitibacter flavus]